MPTIETVNIDDVYPWEDEYGNAYLSRDYSTKANREYVHELARSMRAKGVPDEPVTLARDGGIFRIVAGNSRVMAMRELGTRTFPAVILDDAEAKAAVETAVRTNVKKKYEAAEESNLFQQLLIFGDDQYVSEVAGIDAGQVAKIRRARRVVDDAAEDMSLDRLVAIAEFEGDEQAVAALAGCKESEWERVARDQRWRIEREENDRRIREALEGAGIVVLAERPQGAIFVTYVSTPEGMPETGGPLAPSCAVRSGNGGYSLLRMPNADDEESERVEAERREEAAVQKEHDRLVAARCAERRTEWLAARLANGGAATLPNLQRGAIEEISDERGVEWLEGHGIAPTAGPVEIAAWVTRLDAYEYGAWWYGWGGSGTRTANDARTSDWHEIYKALAADGYEMDDEERDMFELYGEE